MRYSYCWDVALRDIPSWPEGVPLGSVPFFIHNSKTDAELAREEGLRATWHETVAKHWLRERYVRVQGRVGFVWHEPELVNRREAKTHDGWLVRLSDGSAGINVLLSNLPEGPQGEAGVVTFRGRLDLTAASSWAMQPLGLDATAGRWHAASVGGLVVGAMWMLVFGLYLRSWLRARKTPAAPQ